MKNSTIEHAIDIRLLQTQNIPLDVQLYCNSGELLALVGPSGSGKTTILRTIAGLYRPQHCKITCQGETWNDSTQNIFLPAHARHVGLVFQNYALFPHMTVLQNILQALNDLPKEQRIDTALQCLQQVHLQGLEQRYPKTLSGGQQQRVAVARALARRPKVLLLDEPFSAVDQVTRRKLHRELLKLRHNLPIPMILVTHDLEESTLLADRITLLHKGEILQSGSPKLIASQPKNATVARLMDQQNLFTAQVTEHDHQHDRTRLLWRGHTLEARLQDQFTVQDRVCWMIQSADILLHSRLRPSNGDRENPLSGTVIEYFESNGQAHLLIEIDKTLKINIVVHVPVHVAKRNYLAIDEHVSISLLAEGIHLMPYQQLRREH